MQIKGVGDAVQKVIDYYAGSYPADTLRNAMQNVKQAWLEMKTDDNFNADKIGLIEALAEIKKSLSELDDNGEARLLIARARNEVTIALRTIVAPEAQPLAFIRQWWMKLESAGRDLVSWCPFVLAGMAAWSSAQTVSDEQKKVRRPIVMATTFALLAFLLQSMLSPGPRGKVDAETEQLLKCLSQVRPILANLPEGHFRASSYCESNPLHAPHQSKVNSAGYCWAPSHPLHNQYLDVHLGGMHLINQIDIHARRDMDQWVTKFSILYTESYNEPFKLLCSPGDAACQFNGPNGRGQFMTHRNFKPFNATIVRLDPREWVNHPSLHWELFGCKVGPHSAVIVNPGSAGAAGSGLPAISAPH